MVNKTHFVSLLWQLPYDSHSSGRCVTEAYISCCKSDQVFVLFYEQKELKLLCRRGIPDQYRAEVWKKLVYEQVVDIIEEKGPHYYNHLVNVAYDSQVREGGVENSSFIT